MRACLTAVGSLVVVLSLAALSASADTPYEVQARYSVSGDGSFDYLTLDSSTRRLYVSHATQVDVLDADSGKVVGSIPDTPGVHGIAIASSFKHGFTSNGAEDKVSMFDSETLKVIMKIEVGKGPDGIYYDPGTKRVFTNNHGSHDISAIDASTGKVIGTVEIGGDGEQAVVGADGFVYVSSENTDEIVVFDPKTLQVKKRLPVVEAKGPAGLAYDSITNRLFIALHHDPKMVVMDAGSGKTVSSFPIGNGADFAGFDPESRLIFLSCSDGTLNIFHQGSADEYENAGTVKTQPSAKTMAFDPKTKNIFLSAAEIEVIPPTDPSQRPVRKIKPGSFVVLVVGK